MRFISTRDDNLSVSLSETILSGLASDGGLFVPEKFPKFTIDDFDSGKSLQEIAIILLKPFFAGDILENKLESIINKALNFDIPVKKINSYLVLELFHGPTGAFKDVGARFLAQCFAELEEQRTILVATSGDTGSAVASAFYGLKNTKVVILYPKNKISAFQEMQLTCWDNNILSLRVDSDFDTCQNYVKQAFNDGQFEQFNLSSANSINMARVLPQMIYYAASSINYYREHNTPPSYIIPTGNMGNALACIWCKHMGIPVDRIILSTNSNDTIPIYLETGEFRAKASISTLANAMDVGNPSNLERYRLGNINTELQSYSVTDEQISKTIKQVYESTGYAICPHTATAFYGLNNFEYLDNKILVSTAHPAKFADIVEPLIGHKIDIPNVLGELSKREEKVTDISTYQDLFDVLLTFNDHRKV